jgi:hypothetical protein
MVTRVKLPTTVVPAIVSEALVGVMTTVAVNVERFLTRVRSTWIVVHSFNVMEANVALKTVAAAAVVMALDAVSLGNIARTTVNAVKTT